MELEELYKRYGELVIQAEIINNKIMETKRTIGEMLNKLPTLPKKEKEITKGG